MAYLTTGVYSTNLAYVANYDKGSTVIIGDSGIIGEVSVGTNPTAIAVNQATGHIYAANSGSNNVSVIAGPTGAEPASPATPAPVPPGTAPQPSPSAPSLGTDPLVLGLIVVVVVLVLVIGVLVGRMIR